jgi:hypothetical protein
MVEWRYSSTFIDLGIISVVPLGYQTWWAPDPVWTLWRIQKFLTLAGNRTATVQPVDRRYTD